MQHGLMPTTGADIEAMLLLYITQYIEFVEIDFNQTW